MENQTVREVNERWLRPCGASWQGTLNSARNQFGAHDAVGNPQGVPVDWENRILSYGGESYMYAADGKRVLRRKVDGTYEVTLWSGGVRMGIYRFAYNSVEVRWDRTVIQEDIYIGGRRMTPADRLGSNLSHGKVYLPYGEELTATAQSADKWATYRRDDTGLDYADQRYYQPGWGRFLTADPYLASGGAGDPASWNRYSYTRGDPVNRFDPAGLEDCSWDPKTNTLNCRGPAGPLPIPSTPSGPMPQDVPDFAHWPRESFFLGYATDLANRVIGGDLNDCEAMVAFAGQVAALAVASGTSAVDAIGAFGVLVPTEQVPSSLRSRLNSVPAENAIYFGNTAFQKTGQKSGYRSAFEDSLSPEGDQGHHFAAFLQLGAAFPKLALAGGGAGAFIAALGLESSNWFSNSGDVELGFAAATLGARIATGAKPLQNLATEVSQLCDFGPQR